MNRKVITSLAIAALLMLNVFRSASQEWNQFRGPGFDNKVSGFKSPAAWPSELKLVWKVQTGTGDASPVLSGGRIYMNTRQGDNEIILCLDAVSGKEVWRNSYSAPSVTGGASSHPGPRSTPAVINGEVFTYGVSGILSCLDAASGKLLWRRDNPGNLYPEFFAATSPLILDGNCIIYTGKKDMGSLLCLDMVTGKEKWSWTGEGPVYSTPSVMVTGGKKQLILFSEKNLMSVDASSGKLLWKIPTALKQWFYNSASAVVDGQVIYYTGQGTGTRAIKVVKEGDSFVPKELWTNTATGTKWNTPVLINGFLYGFSDTRKIFCINTSDGKTAWTDNTTNSDFATLVDCGSVLIGLPTTGKLLIFKPDSKGYTELAKYKVADTPVYSYPLISGDAIYVKDEGSLMMYRF
jgi:outer membrane protein assembly factor BamB